jgi:hypothetical protein
LSDYVCVCENGLTYNPLEKMPLTSHIFNFITKKVKVNLKLSYKQGRIFPVDNFLKFPHIYKSAFAC